MFVEKQQIDGSVVLRVKGIIKLGESAEFLVETLERVLEKDQGNVLLDLEQINYIDSTGIGELVAYLGRFQSRNRKLILIKPSERIRKLLAVAQLDRLFEIHGSVEEALAPKS